MNFSAAVSVQPSNPSRQTLAVKPQPLTSTRHWRPGEAPIAHGRVIEHGRHDDRGLLEVRRERHNPP